MFNKNEISCRSFRGKGGETEHFIFIKAPAGGGGKEQLGTVEARYARALKALGLAPGTAVFRRVFLSDALNQADLVRESGLCVPGPANPVSVSIVQQPPLPAGRIALLAYHIQGRLPLVKRRLSAAHVLVERNGLRHLWSAGLGPSGKSAAPASSEEQTGRVFHALIGALAGQGGTLRDNCVRTWIFLKNVDVFYEGMVKARRGLFRRQGLTADTHYIASTGIEGGCGRQSDLVGLDAYSILGLEPRQVSYLNDYSKLCPTKDYRVTFERGTRVAYADRAHYFISGTASIDKAGNILYPGDVRRQLARARGNIKALLKSGGAKLADVMYLIVYLRDPADLPAVDAYLKRGFPAIPALVVRGAVCRPGWLVEVEGVAVTKNSDPSLPAF